MWLEILARCAFHFILFFLDTKVSWGRRGGGERWLKFLAANHNVGYSAITSHHIENNWGVGGEGGEEVEGVGSEMGELGGWRRVSNPPAGGSTMREISRAAKDNGGGGDGGQTRS